MRTFDKTPSDGKKILEAAAAKQKIQTLENHRKRDTYQI